MDIGVYNQIMDLNQDLLDIRESLDFFLQDSASRNSIGYSQVAEYIERIQTTGYDLDFPDINYSSASRAEALNQYESGSIRLDLSVEYMNSWNPAWTSSVGHEPPRGMVYFPVIDTSNVTDMSGMFRVSTISYIPYLDTSKVQNAYQMFLNCPVYSLPLLDFSNVTNATQLLSFSINLRSAGGFAGLKVDLDLHSCRNLTKQSVHNIITHLGVPDTTAILTFYSSVYNQISEEDLALAQSKNWSVVSY